jgi:uncharacterized protein (TIGR02996 family)
MNQRESLHRAILADPDDMAVRLVYADWLADQDDPTDQDRAEFIRVERELTSLDEDNPRRDDLKSRRGELLKQHGETWFGELGCLGCTLDETHLGFADAVTISTATFLKNGEAIFQHSPVRRVLFLDDDRRHIAALCSCPQLEHVRRVAFGDGCYYHAITYAGARKLAASPYVCNLEEIDLFESKVGRTGMVALASSPHLKKLKRLELPENAIGDEGALAIANAGHWSGLEGLQLRNCGITYKGLVALAGAEHLCGLRELSLMGNQFGGDGGRVVAESTWRNLQELDLSSTGLPYQELVPLARSPVVVGLRKLRLCFNAVRAVGMKALVDSPHWNALEELELSQTGLKPDAVEVLVKAWPFRQLRKLKLDRNPLGDEGLALLAHCPHLRGIRDLDLSDTGVRDANVRELADSPHLAGLHTLWLSNDKFTDAGAKILAASPHLSERVKVHAHSSRLSKQGKQILEDRFGR